MRLTVGQLKCAQDFTKQITSAERELSHEITLRHPTRQFARDSRISHTLWSAAPNSPCSLHVLPKPFTCYPL